VSGSPSSPVYVEGLTVEAQLDRFLVDETPPNSGVTRERFFGGL